MVASSTWPVWTFVCTAVLLTGSIRDGFAQGPFARTELGARTKRAYIMISKHHASSLFQEGPLQTGVPVTSISSAGIDDAQMVASKKGLFADIRAVGEIDPELKDIVADIDRSMEDLFVVFEEWEQMPQTDRGMNNLRSLYYGLTWRFNQADDLIKGLEVQSAQAKNLARRMLNAFKKEEAAVLLLPRIAKKLAGPVAQGSNPIVVDINEVWGFQGPDQLALVNRSGRTLHHCTVVVVLIGQAGDLKKNVHFVELWPEGRPLYAQYQPGQRVLDEVAFRQTVNLIQRAEISIFCDELACEDIVYRYAGEEKDKDISSFLDKHFKPVSEYRPFAKGFLWDDQRAVKVAFSGLNYLPRGTMVVTIRNGAENSTRKVNFDPWAAGKLQVVEFLNITWEASEWTIRFEFDGTEVYRSYRWTR